VPIIIDIDSAVYKWQAKHGEKMTYRRLSELTEMSLAQLNRIKSTQGTSVSLDKLNSICKVLECNIEDIVIRKETGIFSRKALEEYEINRITQTMDVQEIRDDDSDDED